ncbi:hypothetical protein HaLaN_10126 [Haematococcus lacustris]|uniref:Uncharacterized protein n=1 Tax=Haematococcus lacustris TaxID=44745 RepID=A0A699YWP6_HAELA|nr:hypothetical protein HaLaN_10126 [Haematococcus lacustris]
MPLSQVLASLQRDDPDAIFIALPAIIDATRAAQDSWYSAGNSSPSEEVLTDLLLAVELQHVKAS